MLADEHLELTDELGVAAECEVGLEPPLERLQAELFEPRDSVCTNDSWARSASAGPRQRSRASRSRSAAGSGAASCASSTSCLEAKQVELVRTDADHITRLLRDDHLAWSECLAEL